jgi:hypothetical protein
MRFDRNPNDAKINSPALAYVLLARFPTTGSQIGVLKCVLLIGNEHGLSGSCLVCESIVTSENFLHVIDMYGED